MSRASGLAALDVDAEPELSIADVRLTSVHASGRTLSWRIVARKDLTVGELLRAVAARSQATHSPFHAQSAMLVELMHGRLHRTFELDARLERLRCDDQLVIYELPAIEEVDEQSSQSKVQTVACHARFVRDPANSFFDEDDRTCDLMGIPFMFQVQPGVSQRRLFEIVGAGMYGTARAQAAVSQSRPPFELYYCEQVKSLSTSGRRLDPASAEPAPLAIPFSDRGAAMLAAEWSAAAQMPPWVAQQASRALRDAPESVVELLLGVDVFDLARQVRVLREHRQELRAEVEDLRRCLGRYTTKAAEAARPRPPDTEAPASGRKAVPAAGAAIVSGSSLATSAPRRELLSGIASPAKPGARHRKLSPQQSPRHSPRHNRHGVFSQALQDAEPRFPDDLRMSLLMTRCSAW
mmetsp:Transcript_67278/g.217168  ORF Transcript_67278/g.217168 Transcript_67278/m.217168 type:complete len:408 (-) Transcript_67278:65-1288(-)